MGVANDRSIAWGIARVLHGQGAELAFSYQGGAFGRRAVPLAQGIGASIIEEADVEDLPSIERSQPATRYAALAWTTPCRISACQNGNFSLALCCTTVSGDTAIARLRGSTSRR
jgi:hypothetical protein